GADPDASAVRCGRERQRGGDSGAGSAVECGARLHQQHLFAQHGEAESRARHRSDRRARLRLRAYGAVSGRGLSMRGGPLLGILTAVVLICPVELSAQAAAVTTGREGSDSDSWSVSFTSDVYFVPDSPFFVSSTVIADHGWLHLEGRYNYEERHTGSLWF